MLYNYPLIDLEFAALEKENILINSIEYVKEGEDVVEEETEPQLDAKGKPIQKKANKGNDAGKPVNDAFILKNYLLPTNYNENYTYENVLNLLKKGRLKSKRKSLIRSCLFDNTEFHFKNIDDPKKTYFNVYQEEFIEHLKEVYMFYLMYNQWSELK